MKKLWQILKLRWYIVELRFTAGALVFQHDKAVRAGELDKASRYIRTLNDLDRRLNQARIELKKLQFFG